MKKEELIQNPKNFRPHVVLLGAGTTRAAFPNGDANGNKIPLMNDFVDILNLEVILRASGINLDSNFEVIYSQIQDNNLKKIVEETISRYFSNMQLPATATHYDRLLLFLREKDAIFTFNWDPFLFDAYKRNMSVAPLPEIFFLHGNVRIGSCHNKWGERNTLCPICDQTFTNVPLLYPVEKKDYFNSNEYTKSSWENAKLWISNAFTITIFGYSAPVSDIEAVDLIRRAWFENSERTLEHVEVIDNESQSIIYERWQNFTPTHHFTKLDNFDQSRLWRWPRRSCESLFYPMSQGIPCEDFPLPPDDSLEILQKYIQNIAVCEND